MATKEHQFDVTAKLDFQELKNAIVQAQKEANNRYDFKVEVKISNLVRVQKQLLLFHQVIIK